MPSDFEVAMKPSSRLLLNKLYKVTWSARPTGKKTIKKVLIEISILKCLAGINYIAADNKRQIHIKPYPGTDAEKWVSSRTFGSIFPSTKLRAKEAWWNILVEEYSSILLHVVLSVARARQVTDAHSWLDCLFHYLSFGNNRWVEAGCPRFQYM